MKARTVYSKFATGFEVLEAIAANINQTGEVNIIYKYEDRISTIPISTLNRIDFNFIPETKQFNITINDSTKSTSINTKDVILID